MFNGVKTSRYLILPVKNNVFAANPANSSAIAASSFRKEWKRRLPAYKPAVNGHMKNISEKDILILYADKEKDVMAFVGTVKT
jgi:transcription elongation factor